MNFYGLAIAVVTFLIIGAFHPIVIKAEYHFTYRCWPVFLAAGLILIGISVFINDPIISCILGVTGCSCLWSIKELKEQHGLSLIHILSCLTQQSCWYISCPSGMNL